jgi:hypothetical protein
MSVSEQYSGIVESHISAIEKTAITENTFVFVRPTEFDSTILIKAGYATKSMDVHHKSSNWGPMAGFVPCDPAFSKKCIDKPNSLENEKKHDAAHPTQLALKPELLHSHTKIQFPDGFTLTANKGARRGDVPWMVTRSSGKGKVNKAREKFEAFQTSGGNIPEHKFCTPLPAETGVKSTLFCLVRKNDEWLVYWVGWQGDKGILHPLRVFAYAQGGRLNPVTGDYDLWMVAPHFKNFDKHAIVSLEKDKHGASAASAFTMGLMQKMNANCGRSDNHVFHHGAEAQNYGFTQGLDWDLAMFTPSGQSRMVRMNQMAAILSDLQNAGYLVVWNKRYGEIDPHLSSQADKRGEHTLSEIRDAMEKMYGELNLIKANSNSTQIAQEWQSSQKMPSAMKNELGIMANRFKKSRELGLEQSRIYRFHRKLMELLKSQQTSLHVLNSADFPASYQAYETGMRNIHHQLQTAMVKATTGKGQSEDDLLLAVTPLVEKLKRYWV